MGLIMAIKDQLTNLSGEISKISGIVQSNKKT